MFTKFSSKIAGMALIAVTFATTAAQADSASFVSSVVESFIGGGARGIGDGVANGARGVGDGINMALGGVEAQETMVSVNVRGGVSNITRDEATANTIVGRIRGVKGGKHRVFVDVDGGINNTARDDSTSNIIIGTIGR